RYYTSAALMGMWGDDSFMSLRWAMMIFEAAVIFGALLLIYSAKKIESALFWLLASLILLPWLQPYYKMHDFMACLLLLGGLAYLASHGGRTSHFLAGICVGLAALLGRNHGIYGILGSLGLMLWLAIGTRHWTGFIRCFLIWCIGVVVGFAPMLLLMAIAPGFATSFWASVLLTLEYLQIPLPVP